MNKQQLQKLLAIARPAIIAVYGRGSGFSVTAYNVMSDNCLWMEIEAFYWPEWELFKVRIEDNKVTYLNKGTLM